MIIIDGQNRKIPMLCSFMNCGYESDCISEAFKHFEKEYSHVRTTFSSFFIDNKKTLLFWSSTNSMQSDLNCYNHKSIQFSKRFHIILSTHYIKTNINNKNYQDLVPQLECSQHWVYIHCNKCKILLKDEVTLIAI